MEFERSFLGNEFRYPRDGEIYEAVIDVEIAYLTQWASPYTGGDSFVLKAGEQIKVDVSEHNPEPLTVFASSTDPERLEEQIVPKDVRGTEGYGGYCLAVECIKLRDCFRLVA